MMIIGSQKNRMKTFFFFVENKILIIYNTHNTLLKQKTTPNSYMVNVYK